VVSQTDAVTFTGCLREPGSQAVKLLHITQNGSVPKAEGGRTELGKRADRAAALLAINGQEARHLTQAWFACEEMDIAQHIAHNRYPVGFAKVYNLTRSMTGQMDDPKSGDFVSVMEHLLHRIRRSPSYRIQCYSEEIAGERRSTSLHGRDISLMAGQRNVPCFANLPGRVLMVRVAVSQCHQRERDMGELVQDARRGPARTGINEDILDEIRIDSVWRITVQFPDMVSDHLHVQFS